MRIGVFDTGYGGEIVAERLTSQLHEHEYIVVNDKAHLPYGDRSSKDIRTLTDRAIQPLIGNCPLIVIACNTATAHAIEWLRHTYPDTLFVGFEPMVKTAHDTTKTNHITICATKATLISHRYQQLIERYGADMNIDTPETATWAQKIEHNHVAQIDLHQVGQSIKQGSDVIVLACTHYLALEHKMKQKWPNAQVIEPTAAVIDRIRKLTA